MGSAQSIIGQKPFLGLRGLGCGGIRNYRPGLKEELWSKVANGKWEDSNLPEYLSPIFSTSFGMVFVFFKTFDFVWLFAISMQYLYTYILQ